MQRGPPVRPTDTDVAKAGPLSRSAKNARGGRACSSCSSLVVEACVGTRRRLSTPATMVGELAAPPAAARGIVIVECNYEACQTTIAGCSYASSGTRRVGYVHPVAQMTVVCHRDLPVFAVILTRVARQPPTRPMNCGPPPRRLRSMLRPPLGARPWPDGRRKPPPCALPSAARTSAPRLAVWLRR